MTTPGELLRTGARRLAVALDDAQATQLLALSDELIRWNKTYNLTALDSPGDVLTHHLLDSLCISTDLKGPRVADVGTGAGFPGLPLAIVHPELAFTLIDSAGKKLRFIAHVARALKLKNVTTLHARVEQLAADPYDSVVTRAFAPMPRLLEWVRPLCDAHTRVIAMKGRWPPPEGSDDAGPLPAGWHIDAVRLVDIPGLAAERHVVTLRVAAPAP